MRLFNNLHGWDAYAYLGVKKRTRAQQVETPRELSLERNPRDPYI